MRTLIISTLISILFMGCNYESNTNRGGRFMLASLPIYPKYFVDTNKKLFGLSDQGIISIPILDTNGDTTTIDDFFSVDGIIYITRTTTVEVEDPNNPGTFITETLNTFYKQEDGIMSEVPNIPAKPTQGRKQLLSSEFTMEDFDYLGTLCTDIRNLYMSSGIERNYLVNAYCYITGYGLYFYIKEGRDPVIRPEGLYFWPLAKPAIQKMKDIGEVW